jgi:hypothetical protein
MFWNYVFWFSEGQPQGRALSILSSCKITPKFPMNEQFSMITNHISLHAIVLPRQVSRCRVSGGNAVPAKRTDMQFLAPGIGCGVDVTTGVTLGG